jgi:DNA polymerase III subunit epsilon
MKLLDPCGCFPTGKHYPGIAHLIKVRVVGVADEFDPDDAWGDIPLAVLDTETTGTDPRVDRVVEVGIVIGLRGEITTRKSWLINPGIPISKEASEVHGITDEQVKDSPPFSAVAGEILAALQGALPGAYNAAFDRAFIHAELARAGVDLTTDAPPAAREEIAWVDPLVFARELYKGQGESRALGAIAERLGVTLVQAHRATDDAEAALLVLYALSRDQRVPRTYAALLAEQRRLERLQVEATRFWRKN